MTIVVFSTHETNLNKTDNEKDNKYESQLLSNRHPRQSKQTDSSKKSQLFCEWGMEGPFQPVLENIVRGMRFIIYLEVGTSVFFSCGHNKQKPSLILGQFFLKFYSLRLLQ